jgi:hypothetical protein
VWASSRAGQSETGFLLSFVEVACSGEMVRQELAYGSGKPGMPVVVSDSFQQLP